MRKWAAVGLGVVFTLWLLIVIAISAMQERIIFTPETSALEPPPEGVHSIELTTSDGETLFAFYAPAPRAECLTVLFLNNNAGRIDQETDRIERARALGLGTMLVSWRGYNGSTGKPSEDGFHRDARAGWDWLVNEGGVPSGQIILHGHSIGTGPATKIASEMGPAALILEAPYYSMLELLSEAIPIVPMGLVLRHTFRSDSWIGGVSAPILMAHGAMDETIAPEHSLRLAELAKAPTTRWVSPDANHFDLADHGLYDEALPSFLAAHEIGC